MRNTRGITLIELLYVMIIFAIVMLGLYSAYEVQMNQGGREFRRAESSIEENIASGVIERDLLMAGYGLAEDYSDAGSSLYLNPPRAISATDGGSTDSDTLTLMGTAVGLNTRASQGWTYLISTSPTMSFNVWGDAREDLAVSDQILLLEPGTKKLITSSTTSFYYQYNGSTSNVKIYPGSTTYPFNLQQVGTVLLGLAKSGSSVNQPFSAVAYYLGSNPTYTPANCAPNTLSLLRAESATSSTPSSGQPILNCVLDFQAAFGLDTNSDGSIDLWDNGGVYASSHYAGVTGPATLNQALKQVRVYVLVQVGGYDPNYTYTNPDPTTGYTGTDKIRVGDLYLVGGAVGRDVTLSAINPRLRNYRWKVLSFTVTPRNIRR